MKTGALLLGVFAVGCAAGAVWQGIYDVSQERRAQYISVDKPGSPWAEAWKLCQENNAHTPADLAWLGSVRVGEADIPCRGFYDPDESDQLNAQAYPPPDSHRQR